MHFVEVVVVVVVVRAMEMRMGTSHGRGLGKTKIKVAEPTTIGREDMIRKWLVQVLHHRCKSGRNIHKNNCNFNSIGK